MEESPGSGTTCPSRLAALSASMWTAGTKTQSSLSHTTACTFRAMLDIAGGRLAPACLSHPCRISQFQETFSSPPCALEVYIPLPIPGEPGLAWLARSRMIFSPPWLRGAMADSFLQPPQQMCCTRWNGLLRLRLSRTFPPSLRTNVRGHECVSRFETDICSILASS